MKKLLLLLVIACVSLASCTETLDLNNPNDIKKKFDFSEVDIENIQGLQEEEKFSTPESTVFTGTIDDCAWIGVFDSQSGSLQCQYTDVDHPTSYFAYGEEYRYGVGAVLDAYFERNKLIIVIKYTDPQYNNSGRAVLSSRKDLISVSGDSHCRYILDEKSGYSAVSITKWTDRSIYIILGENGIIYDFDNDVILSSAIGTYGKIENDIYHNLIISPSNGLHFWEVELLCRFGPDYGSKGIRNEFEIHAEDLVIYERKCTYNTISHTTKYMWIYEPISVDSSKTPRYSFEYKIRTNDHILLLTTQTEYDGTITTKTVDIRVENDELKVDIK
ncbi:MAG: hypothetical protein K2F92_00715 [Alistipes sp.]|nr:hypothetical protein [Alistipes sp.]